MSEQEQISRLLTILKEMDVYSDVDTGIILEHIKHLQSENEQLSTEKALLKEQSIPSLEKLNKALVDEVEQLKVKQDASDMQERMVLTKMAEIAEYESVEQMLKCAPFMSDGQEREMQNLRLFVEAMLNEREQLKKQLESAIIPKFKIGQEVWGIMQTDELGTVAYKDVVEEINNTYRLQDDNEYGSYLDEELFATEQEALTSMEGK